MGNTAYSTTGLQNLYLGSNEVMQVQPMLYGQPWNLTGGAASLLLADPSGNLTTIPGTINAGGGAIASWTVSGAPGQWTRSWKLTDPTGFIQFTAPKAFGVVSSVPTPPPSLVQTGSGVIQNFDGTLTNWTGDPNIVSASNVPQYICHPTRRPFFGAFGANDATGVRDCQGYVENNVCYMAYGAGNGTTGWQPQYASSADFWVTWTYQGYMGAGLNKVASGQWASIDSGWNEKRNGVQYFNRIIGLTASAAPNTGLVGSPYYWDVWIGSAFGQCTTPDPTVPTDTQAFHLGAPADVWLLPGCVVLSAGTYYGFSEITGTGSPGIVALAVSTSSAPDGPWTGFSQVSFATYVQIGQNVRTPENPKVFLSPTLGKWVILTNLINPGNAYTDSNAIGYSASLGNSDLQAATWKVDQLVSPIDGSNAIGLKTHITGPDGALIQGPNGEIPATYDTDPTNYPLGWHLGRKLYGAILEPAPLCLQNLTSTADNTWRQKVGLTPNPYTDCVIEFSFCFTAVGATPKARFMYRSDANGINGNCYSILFAGAYQTTPPVLEKWVAGSGSTLTPSNGSLNWQINTNHRVKVVVTGNVHQMYLDGELAWAYTDSSSPLTSGAYVGEGSSGSNTEFRNIRLRLSDTLTVTGLLPGTPVMLRSYGNLPICQTNANGSGVAQITWSHWPHAAVEVNGVILQGTNSQIFGGDIYSYSGGFQLGSPPVQTAIASATMAADGVTLSVTFNQSVVGYYGFALNGNPLLRYTSGEHSNTLIFETAIVTVIGASVTLTYAPGNIIGANGSALAATSVSVTNNTTTTIIVYDNCVAPNGTNLNGRTPSPINLPGNQWSVVLAGFQIFNNRIQSTVLNPGTNGIAVYNAALSDCSIRVTVNSITTGSVRVIFRYQDANNYWIIFFGASSYAFILYKVVAGAAFPMGQGSTFGPSSDHIANMILSGPSITVSWDGNNVLTLTDSTFQTQTSHGLEYNNAVGNQWTNFHITSP